MEDFPQGIDVKIVASKKCWVASKFRSQKTISLNVPQAWTELFKKTFMFFAPSTLRTFYLHLLLCPFDFLQVRPLLARTR